MGDMGEVFREMKKGSRVNRAKNRKAGESTLFLKRIPFLKKNAGAHLIVYPESPKLRIDFWPGTGLWKAYFGDKEGRGLDALVKHLESLGGA